MWTRFIVCLAACLLLGCAGGVKHRVSESVIADLPLAEKQELLAVEDEHNRAYAERQKAEADLMNLDRDVSKAIAERAQARLGVKQVDADIRLAETRKDVVLLSVLQQQREAARLAEQAAETRLNWQQRLRDVGAAVVAATDGALDLTEARRELAKARLAALHNRRPTADFTLTTFEQQVAQAGQRYAARQRDVEDRQFAADDLRRQYDRQLASYTQQRSAAAGYAPTYTPPGYLPPTRPPGQDVVQLQKQ